MGMISSLALSLLLVAAASLSDPSALTQSVAYAQDGRLRLEYSRLGRAGAPTRLRLWVAPGLASEGRLRLRMGQGYACSARIERVTPEPERVETGLEDVVFVFKLPQPRDPAMIEFDVTPGAAGRHDGRLAVVGDRTVEFAQYVLP